MTAEYDLTLADYLSIMRRRAPYLVGIFVVVLIIAGVAAFTIPSSYQAIGTIMVESPQADVGITPSPRNDLDERINLIKQRVMTREGLLQIIGKYNLFKETTDARNTTELVDKIRSRIVVETLSSNDAGHTNQQGLPTIAFTISYEDHSPDVALQVDKDLIDLFLHWNAKLRREGAAETTEFLSGESAKLKAEVDSLEEKIRAYKKQNSENLPEQLNLRESMLARAENDLYSVDRDIRSGYEELLSLEAELAAAKRGVSDDPSQTLPALKAEYTKLSAIYTKSHPDLIALKSKIDALEQGSNTSEQNKAPGNVTNLAAFKLQAKVDAVNARLESLAQQKKMLRQKIDENEHAMELTPNVADRLAVLIGNRDSALHKYDEIRNKTMNAQIAQSLESENQSERFTLLEPPVRPEKPFKPNRMKILAIGFLLAVASAIGTVMLLESIDKRIYGVEAFSHVLGYRPLAVIPLLQTEEEVARKKQKHIWGIFLTIWPWLKSRWRSNLSAP